LVECGRFAHGPTLRQIEIDTAERGKPRTDRSGKVLGGSRFAYDMAQDFARFLFHRAAMFGCAYAKTLLHVVIQISNGDACHRDPPSTMTQFRQ
jgi:hypothetical protein